MSIATEIEALSHACDIDMSDTMNPKTGKFYKHSKNPEVKAKVLLFRSLKEPTLIGKKEIHFLFNFPALRDHFFYLDYDEVIEKFKEENNRLCQMKIAELNEQQTKSIIGFAIGALMLTNSFKSIDHIIEGIFKRGMYFNDLKEVRQFCKGRKNNIDEFYLRQVVAEHALKYDKPQLTDPLQIANMAIAIFIEEFLFGCDIPEGIIMHRDIEVMINHLKSRI